MRYMVFNYYNESQLKWEYTFKYYYNTVLNMDNKFKIVVE